MTRIISKQFALVALEVQPNPIASIAPPPFAARLQQREKRRLGDAFGLTNFGVNLVRIAPHGLSSIRHSHTLQDEFIYVLEGQPVLNTNEGAVTLNLGMCAGFKAGTGEAHHLVNPTDHEVWYLEVGDRTPGDQVTYPDDDLQANVVEGKWVFVHKDGTPY